MEVGGGNREHVSTGATSEEEEEIEEDYDHIKRRSNQRRKTNVSHAKVRKAGKKMKTRG